MVDLIVLERTGVPGEVCSDTTTGPQGAAIEDVVKRRVLRTRLGEVRLIFLSDVQVQVLGITQARRELVASLPVRRFHRYAKARVCAVTPLTT